MIAEWLSQEVIHASSHRVFLELMFSIGCSTADVWYADILLLESLADFKSHLRAIHLRHAVVKNHNLVHFHFSLLILLYARVYELEGLQAAHYGIALVVLGFQQGLHNFDIHCVVIYDEDLRQLRSR